MKKYELTKNTAEFTKSERKDICKGCTATSDNQYTEIIKSLETEDEAIKELEKYESEMRKIGNIYDLTEYYVEENVYDEDGEWVQGGDICAIADINAECYTINGNEIVVGEDCFIEDLCSEDDDIEKILEQGSINIWEKDGDVVVDFEVININDEEIEETEIKITKIIKK